ncbi:MAG: hypothetical protein H5U00_12425 [Clostridia bacterium]|nr:hypothetical protein [Clostridia bacterium]
MVTETVFRLRSPVEVHTADYPDPAVELGDDRFDTYRLLAFCLLVRIEPLIKELQKSVTVLTVVVARQDGVGYAEVKSLVDGGYR